MNSWLKGGGGEKEVSNNPDLLFYYLLLLFNDREKSNQYTFLSVQSI